MHLTDLELSQSTGGAWRSSEAAGGFVARTVCTDTRQLREGDLFVALKGENGDGHDYLDRAVEGGAGGLVIHRADAAASVPQSLPVLIVPDTLRGLGDIAMAWRAKCPAHRTAIVGSAGKTTTKDMLAMLLRHALVGEGKEEETVLASKGNFNNLIGVPLTLFGLESSHRWAILELGMNEPGELKRLTRIAEPDLLVFLAVGSAHVGQFGSRAALLEAKSDALRTLAENVPVLYDADSPNTCEIIRKYGARRPLLSFAVERPADISARNIQARPRGGYTFDLDFGTVTTPVCLPVFGRYNIANATAAAGAAHMLGARPEKIGQAFEKYRASNMRSEVREAGGVTLIVDCYNAGPEGMAGALESLRDLPNSEGRTFLVLGEMLELGEESAELHGRIGRIAADLAPDGVFLIGEGIAAVRDAWQGPAEAVSHFARHEDLARALIRAVRPGDRVFFKGSRGKRLEVVVDLLTKALEAPGPARPRNTQ